MFELFEVEEVPDGGLLPYKSDESARRKISRTPLKGDRILFHGRVPNSFPPLRGTNSTTINYINGTTNYNSNEDNFLFKDFYESIVINIYANKACQQSKMPTLNFIANF